MLSSTVMRGKLTFAAVVALGLLGLAILTLLPAPSHAQTVEKAIPQLTLTGAEENPPVTSNTLGYFSGTLRQNALDFDLSANGNDLTMAHIHVGAKGVNGPVVAFLFGPADPAVNAIHPTGTITQANLVGTLAGNWDGFAAALAKGELYVNVHSVANPSGVIRVQLPAVTLTVSTTPTTTAPRPPATGTGARAGSDFDYRYLGAALVGVAALSLVVAIRQRRAI